MTDLIAWTTTALEDRALHPLLVIAVFTVVFLEIHPFQDGNGRLSRALTTLLLLRAGYAYVPYSSLENIIEQSKEGYYLALRRTQKTTRTNKPDWKPWITYRLGPGRLSCTAWQGKGNLVCPSLTLPKASLPSSAARRYNRKFLP